MTIEEKLLKMGCDLSDSETRWPNPELPDGYHFRLSIKYPGDDRATGGYYANDRIYPYRSEMVDGTTRELMNIVENNLNYTVNEEGCIQIEKSILLVFPNVVEEMKAHWNKSPS